MWKEQLVQWAAAFDSQPITLRGLLCGLSIGMVAWLVATLLHQRMRFQADRLQCTFEHSAKTRLVDGNLLHAMVRVEYSVKPERRREISEYLIESLEGKLRLCCLGISSLTDALEIREVQGRKEELSAAMAQMIKEQCESSDFVRQRVTVQRVAVLGFQI